MNQTPRAAEHYGANLVLEASTLAAVPVTLAVDNLGVGNGIRAILRGTPVAFSRECLGAWLHIKQLCDTTCDSKSHWVPSHDKHYNWRPPDCTYQAGHWRDLNDIADKAASAELRNRKRTSKLFL